MTVRRNQLDAAGDWLRGGGSVLFFGPEGSGKSAALDVLIAAAQGRRVLRCSPARAGVAAPYSDLAVLLSSVTVGERAKVPVGQRELLARIADQGSGHRADQRSDLVTGLDPGAVRLAALSLVRMLAGAGPLLLVVDDLQRLDDATAEVLRFIATRVEDLPIRMVAAEWVPDGSPPRGGGLCPPLLLVLRLDAITLAVEAELNDSRGTGDDDPCWPGWTRRHEEPPPSEP
jgi:hypothetical protein